MRVLRSPLFWAASVTLALACALAAYRYFPLAFSLLHVTITADREQINAQAEKLAREFTLGPDGAQQATTFHTDTIAKTFVELEGGGKQALVAMIESHTYEPYTWIVRRFKEFEQNEVLLRFTPRGESYGFAHTVPETVAGAALPAAQAREIAEQQATTLWHVPLEQYTFIESSQEAKLSGRIDHMFVYERPDVSAGDGKYRVQLTLSGDRLSGINYLMHLPEAFYRRYEQMRSLNQTIYTVAWFFAFILYFIGGCAIGLFILTRKRYTLWRQAVYWGAFVSCGLALKSLNELPLSWMNYSTSISTSGFLLQHGINILLTFAFGIVSIALIFAVAESLTRKAFGNHLQLWHVWSTKNASTYQVLGRTLGGYLMCLIDLGFAIAFYALATRYLGWWVPSETLFDPNILATYVPWIGPAATALFAGFYEECLFRAIPLAGAALIGRYLNRERFMIGIALIVQALIFSAAHANYPMMPAYARLVELFVPSLFFGGLYLYFGLLTTIIWHVTFDLLLMSLPLFVSSAPGSMLQQAAVLAIASIPLLIVLRARLRNRQWHEARPESYNSAWQPPADTFIPEALHTPPVTQPAVFNERKRVYASFIMIVVGCALYFGFTQFVPDAPALTMSRSESLAHAQRTLADKGVTLDDTWTQQASIAPKTHAGMDHRFVWQYGGKNAYRQLIGKYLQPATHITRAMRLSGDIVERAEEWQTMTDSAGTVYRIFHSLPESRPGASLNLEAARTLAHDYVRTQFGLDPATLKEVSAQSVKRPARTDWVFVFSDPQNYPLNEGQARIQISIGGDAVLDSLRFVYVPQEWIRAQAMRDLVSSMIALICYALLGLIFVGVIGRALYYLMTNAIPWRVVIISFVGALIFLILNAINGTPALYFMVNTTQPLVQQLGRVLAFRVIGSIIFAAIFALFMGFVVTLRMYGTAFTRRVSILSGIAIGALLAGCQSLIIHYISSPFALHAEQDYLGFFSAPVWWWYKIISSYVFMTIGTLMWYSFILYVTNQWRTRRALGMLLFPMGSVIACGVLHPYFWWFIALGGTGLGIIELIGFITIMRFELAVVPVMVATYCIMQLCNQVVLGGSLSIVYALTAILGICIVARAFFNQLRNENAPYSE